MSLRNKIFLSCESFLRVPPLLLMDEIFRYSFGLGLNSKFVDYRINFTPGLSSSSRNETTFPEESEENVIETTDDLTENRDSSWISAAQPSFSEIWATAVSDVFSSISASQKDDITQTSFVTPDTPEDIVISSSQSSHYFHISVGDWSSFPQGISEEFVSFVEVFFCLILFGVLLVVFVLSTENLIKLYSFLLSYLSLYVAYIFSPLPSFWTTPFVPMFAYNIFVRLVLSGVYFVTRTWPGSGQYNENGTPTFLDTIMFSLFFVTGVIRFEFTIYIALIIVLQYSLWTKLPDMFMFLKTSLADTKRIRNEFGFSHLIQVESGRLRINTVFRLFWCSKAAYDALYQFCNEPVGLIFRHVMAHGTETLTGIIGLTVTVSAVCHQIGEFLLWILYYGSNSESDANRFGSISTVLFFILSLQTGLTSLDPEKRLDRLLKNIVLLGTALFHALHQMLAPLLHAFRTFQALQIRAVVVSFSFLSLSIVSTVCLLQSSTVSTWSLAVLALAIEFKIKIIISLIISVVVYLSQLVQYPEFMQKMGHALRHVLPNSIWRFFAKLHDQISHEDMVFYLKAFANIAEFITGIFLFINAIWIFIFESASAIRAVGMSIHAYFNIWCESKKGWKIYCQRRTASMKIMSLADATPEQIQNKRDDVCSICYEEMDSAKVTHCGHLFHAVCLRKWLYVQNNCPLCHEVLYAEDALEEQRNNNDMIIAERLEVPPAVVLEIPRPQRQSSMTIRPGNVRSSNTLRPGNARSSNTVRPGNARNSNTIVPSTIVGNDSRLDPVPHDVNSVYTMYNGIRFYDLSPGSNNESDADADDESSDGEVDVDTHFTLHNFRDINYGDHENGNDDRRLGGLL